VSGLGRGGGCGPRAVEGEERKKPNVWAVRGEKKGRKNLVGLGRKEEKREGKRKRESGPGANRKRGRKRIAFKCI
jgi:hypothetical protein